MAGMAPIVLLVGLIMLLYGVAVVAGGRVAATRPLRAHSRTYGLVTGGVGGVLVLVGIGLLAAG